MKTSKFRFLFALLALFVLGSSESIAQSESDTISNLCAKHLEDKFISDGQQYQALLINSSETAEFSLTFYGGTTYRIAACSGLTDGNLVFWIYDSEKNLLFTSKDFENAPYWDFKIENTIDCVIEAKLSSNTSGSGKAVILIGFKQP